MNRADLIYRGSVKDLYREKLGEVTFCFSDRYSVYDWGEMPDALTDKGKSLSLMASYFFDFLGVPKHWSDWRPSVDLEGPLLTLKEDYGKVGLPHHYLGRSEQLTNGIRVKEVNVPNVKTTQDYNYTFYQNKVTNCLIPLEVIFRFGVPKGSSLLKRRDDIREGQVFTTPLIEFSTKLEQTDRYLSWDEAQAMAGLSQEEWSNFLNVIQVISLRLRDFFTDRGLELWDGKFEFAFDDKRNTFLVDTIGPDELRLMLSGLPLSKEFLRQYYSSSSWKKSLDKAKDSEVRDWQTIVKDEGQGPEPLPESYKNCAVNLYRALTNTIYDEVIFEDTPSLVEITKEMKSMMALRSL